MTVDLSLLLTSHQGLCLFFGGGRGVQTNRIYSIITGFSLRTLAAGERFNVAENIFQEAAHLNKNSHRLLTFSQRILDSKQ